MLNQELLDLIYEAALDWGSWARTLSRLSVETGAIGATLFTCGEGQTNALTSPGLDRSMEEFIRGGWDVRNPMPVRFLRRNYQNFKTERDLVTAEEIQSSDFFRGFRAPWGLQGFAGLMVRNAEGNALALSIEAAEALRPETVASLQQLVPHIKRSASLAMKLQNARLESTIGVLGQIGYPAAAVTASGKLISANFQFEELPPGIVVDIRSRIVFCDADVDRGFMEALASIKGRRLLDIRAIPCRYFGPIPAVVYCLPLIGNIRDVFTPASVLVIIRTGQPGGSPDGAILMQMYGLTATEARIAGIAADGATVDEIAAKNGSARETIRSHLKSIYAKTETKGQVDLVLLLQRIRLRA